jgi:hypothetical protein
MTDKVLRNVLMRWHEWDFEISRWKLIFHVCKIFDPYFYLTKWMSSNSNCIKWWSSNETRYRSSYELSNREFNHRFCMTSWIEKWILCDELIWVINFCSSPSSELARMFWSQDWVLSFRIEIKCSKSTTLMKMSFLIRLIMQYSLDIDFSSPLCYQSNGQRETSTSRAPRSKKISS